MTTTFQTCVAWLPPTPLGLLPGRWRIAHQCNVCHDVVATNDLVAHAQNHSDQTTQRPRSLTPE